MDEVWRLHADVNAWTTWQSDITTASIEGAVEVGKSFSWSSYGLAVTSTIYAIADHSRVLWGGTGAGITGIHEWLFVETADGVHVTTKSFAGQPVEADATNIQSVPRHGDREPQFLAGLEDYPLFHLGEPYAWLTFGWSQDR